MNKVILILFFIFFSNGELNAQKTKKLFSYLQENNLNLALEEYDKIKFDKVYDADKKLLFEIADCIFQINKSYSKYNPIESIKHFNKIYFNGFITYAIEDKEAIIKFLSKYNLTLEDISSNIYTEIVNEAKKINTVEYYDKALEVCSEKYSFELTKLKEEAFYRQTINERTIGAYKTFILTYSNSKHISEIQALLECKVFDNAKISASLYDINTFLAEYPTSNLKQEAIDFRDSIVLSNVPNNFDAMLTFTNNYPNSKLTLNVINKLPNILYKELIKSKYDFTKCLKFIKTYPLDNRIIQLDSIIFKKVSQIDSVSGFEKYINLFENGIFKNIAQKKIDEKTISYEKILKCYSLDTLNLFLNCENILSHSKVFLYQVCLALSINKLKENTLLKNVKNESIAKTIFPTYQGLIETDEEYSKENNYSEKIILEITKAKDILTFIKYNSYADSIDNIYRLMYEFSPYLNGYTRLYKANNTYIGSYFSLEVIGNRFITLFKCYGTRSSKIYEIFLVKNSFIQSVDLSHFENTMKNHLKTKFPLHECYSITTSYKFINNKNEILIYGDIYRSMRRKNLDDEFDGVCCPSYQFKAIARSNKNKLIVKTISSTKSLN